MVIFDSSILVDHLKGIKAAKELVKKVRSGEVAGSISAITEAEILSGKECDDMARRKIIEELIEIFNKFPVDNDISRKAGEFRRKYDTPLLDSIIAATAFYQRDKVWTRDIEHFLRIHEITSEEPY